MMMSLLAAFAGCSTPTEPATVPAPSPETTPAGADSGATGSAPEDTQSPADTGDSGQDTGTPKPGTQLLADPSFEDGSEAWNSGGVPSGSSLRRRKATGRSKPPPSTAPSRTSLT